MKLYTALSDFLFERVSNKSVIKHLRRSIVLISLSVIMVISFSSAIFMHYLRDNVIKVSGEAAVKRLEVTLPGNLWQFDVDSVDTLIAAESSSSVFRALEVVNDQGGETSIHIITMKDPDTNKLRKLNTTMEISEYKLIMHGNLEHNGNKMGYFNYYLTSNYLDHILDIIFYVMLGVSLTILIFLVIIQDLLLNKFVWSRLRTLTASLKNLSEKDLSSSILDRDSSQEFGNVIENITAIQQKLVHLVEVSEDEQHKLEATVDELKKTQEVLVQSEKMAALGNLVAGVSHELNTPIGNGLVTVTTLAENTKEFRQLQADGKMTKASFAAYLDQMQHGLEISTRSLQRSAKLIESFKQIAVDQSNEQMRDFHLVNTVKETLEILHSTYKNTKITITTDIDPLLKLHTYPGSIYQILANLINNALIHAFDPNQVGNINISATADDKIVTITVTDNGKGITPENVKKIFDPFFTTRFGQGGSGLGLSISKNLAKKSLQGDLLVASEVGKGTTFTLTLRRYCNAGEITMM